ASGIHAGDGAVSGSGLAAGVDGVHQLFQMAVGVVAVLDAVVGVAGAVAGGIEALEGAAELVVGDLLVVVGVTAADTQAGDGLAGTTELIVFHQFEIAADGVLDTGEPAEAIGGTVVGPGGVAVAGAPRQAVDAGDQAAEAVMGQGAGLALGVGLQGEFAKAVVLVAPGALVGVVHGGLAAQQVVTQAGEVAGVVHRAGEVALGVVALAEPAAEVIDDADQFPLGVAGLGFGLTLGVGQGGDKAAVGGAGGAVVREGGGGDAIEVVVADGGPGRTAGVGGGGALDPAQIVVLGELLDPLAGEAQLQAGDLAAQCVVADPLLAATGGAGFAVEGSGAGTGAAGAAVEGGGLPGAGIAGGEVAGADRCMAMVAGDELTGAGVEVGSHLGGNAQTAARKSIFKTCPFDLVAF